MTSSDTIRVEHWDQHKHKVFSEKVSSHVSFVEQKFDDSCHREAGRCLYGMHSGRYKDDGLVCSEPDYFLVAEGKSFGDLKAIFTLMGRDDNEVEYSPLIGFI